MLIVLIGINTHGAVSVSYFKLSKDQLRIYVGNIIYILCISFAIVLLISLILSNALTELLGFPATWLPIITLSAFFQFLTSLNLVLWQAEQRPIPYGLTTIAYTILNLALSLIFIMFMQMQWEGRLYGIIISTILFGTINFYIMLKRGYISFTWNPQYFRDALKFGIPLIPHSLSGLINTTIDRIMLTAMIGIAATGLYTVGFQVGTVISLLATSFNTAWVPYLYQTLKENKHSSKIHIVQFTYLYFVVIVLLALLLGFAAPPLLKIFVGHEFQSSAEYVIWIALAYAAQGMYFMVANYIFYMKKTRILAILTFTNALLNIGLTYWFVSARGAIGAAQSTTISYFIVFFAIWILSNRIYKMPWLRALKFSHEPK